MKRLGSGAIIALALTILAVALTQHRAHSALPSRTMGEELIVTSTRDAGPGSLRDAILAADRLTSRAHIVIAVPHIVVESGLPALINPNGVDIEARPDAATLDGERQPKGPVLQINAKSTVVHGIHVVNAHEVGILVNAAGVRLDSVIVSNSKTGVLVAAAAAGCVINASTFESDETAVTAESGVHELSIIADTFRGNTRAGFWLVGAEAPEHEAGHEFARIVDSLFEQNHDGVVLANHATLIQKSRFVGSKDSGVLLLGGMARIEDSEFRDSLGTALSINSGRRVVVSRNRFVDNASNAVLTRDSEVTLERNILTHNGFGMVAVQSHDRGALMRENTVSQSLADAVTLIGGDPQLQRNQIIDNHGAGLRVLDLTSSLGTSKASPRLEDNVIKGNGIDVPPPGIYKVAAVR